MFAFRMLGHVLICHLFRRSASFEFHLQLLQCLAPRGRTTFIMIVLLKTKRRNREKMLAPEHTKGVCVVVEMCWLDKVTMSSDNLSLPVQKACSAERNMKVRERTRNRNCPGIVWLILLVEKKIKKNGGL